MFIANDAEPLYIYGKKENETIFSVRLTTTARTSTTSQTKTILFNTPHPPNRVCSLHVATDAHRNCA